MDDASTIFIVDDDPAICAAIRRLLAPLGRPVRAFSSAEQFLAAIGPGARGCLLLDVCLPGMSGLELRRQLAADGSGLSVILVTAHHDTPAVRSAVGETAAMVLPKPFQRDQLLAAISQATVPTSPTPTSAQVPTPAPVSTPSPLPAAPPAASSKWR